MPLILALGCATTTTTTPTTSSKAPSPATAPASSPASAPASAPALPPREPASVQSALQGALPEIQACYQSALDDNPGLNGKLKVRWRINPAGVVDEIETLEDTVGDEGVRACVEAAVRGIAFEPAGTETVVGYPFVFAPAL